MSKKMSTEGMREYLAKIIVYIGSNCRSESDPINFSGFIIDGKKVKRSPMLSLEKLMEITVDVPKDDCLIFPIGKEERQAIWIRDEPFWYLDKVLINPDDEDGLGYTFITLIDDIRFNFYSDNFAEVIELIEKSFYLTFAIDNVERFKTMLQD